MCKMSYKKLNLSIHYTGASQVATDSTHDEENAPCIMKSYRHYYCKIVLKKMDEKKKEKFQRDNNIFTIYGNHNLILIYLN